MRFLLVDFHVGCIMATASALEDLGHSVDILSFSSHNSILKGPDVDRRIIGGRRRLELMRRLGFSVAPKVSRRGIHVFNVNIREASKKPDHHFSNQSAEYDVAWVNFPPALYRRVVASGLATRVVLSAAHRIDLWIQGHQNRLDFYQDLRRDSDSGQLILLAANDYDKAYIEFYAEVSCEVLDPYFPYLSRLRDKIWSKPDREVIFGPANLDFEPVKKLFSIPTDLNVQSPITSMGLRSIREIYPHYEFSDLIAHSGFVLLPYSVFSISLSELAALGRPLFIPTDKWLSESKLLNDVRLWPIYSDSESVFQLPIDRTTNSPNSQKLSMDWLRLASWHSFPNVQFWESVDDLNDLISSQADSDFLMNSTNAHEWELKKKYKWIRTISEIQTMVEV